MQAANAQASLRICANSPEPSLLAYALYVKSCAPSYIVSQRRIILPGSGSIIIRLCVSSIGKSARLAISRLAPVLITIFHQGVVSYTCSQSNSDGSVLRKTEPSELDWLQVYDTTH